MARQLTVELVSDSSKFEAALANAGSASEKFGAKVDSASGKADGFKGAMDNVGGAVGNTEGKFMGAADLLDGLGGAFGLPTEGATGLMRAFGDLSGGFEVVQGMMTSGIGKIGQLASAMANSSMVTKAWTGVQAAFNAVMAANPAVLIGAAIIALGAALVLAYQKSETFRNVVHAAINVVRGAAEGFLNFFLGIPDAIGRIGGTVRDALIWPYKTAFNAIASLWNNTVGRLSFEIPSWVPGLGGKGFSMPKLPEFRAAGGSVLAGSPYIVGERGPELFVPGRSGTIVPNGAGGAGTSVVVNMGIVGDPSQAARQIVGILQQEQRRSGSLGLT